MITGSADGADGHGGDGAADGADGGDGDGGGDGWWRWMVVMDDC